MRHHGLVLAAVPFMWIACVSSSDVPDAGLDASVPDSATPSFDGAPPPFDSAPPAQDSTIPDAPVTDAAAEAAIDATPPAASVTVIGATGPEVGAQIVWGTATGDVVTTSTTDATGTATQAIAGTTTTMVTAVLGTASAPWMYTITGIEPGDRLVVLDQSSIAAATGLGSVTLTSVPTPLPAGNAGLTFYVGYCNSADQGAGVAVPMSISLFFGQNQLACLGLGQFGGSVAAAFPALVEANDQAGNMLGFATAKNNGVSPADGGPIDVTVAGAWSTSTTQQTVVQNGAPDAGAAFSSWLSYAEVANGVMLPLPQRQLSDGGQLPAGTTLYTTHAGYADFVQIETGYNPSGAQSFQEGFALATRGPAPTADGTTTIDASPLASLPSFVGIKIDGSTVARPIAGWTTSAGTLASSTGVLVRMSWGTTPTDGAPPQSGDWTIVSAGTAQSTLQAPALPAALAAYAPQAGAQFGAATVYAIQGGTALPAYPLVRAAASTFYLQNACITRPVIPPLPLAGTLMVSAYTSGGCG